MEDTKKVLYSEVLRSIQEKVNDVFLEMQKSRGINNGDVSPLLALELETKERALSGIVTEILMYQEGSV